MKRSYLWAVWLWAMQAVTGLLLVVYVIVHTLDNATILLGNDKYESMLSLWHDWLPEVLYVLMVIGLSAIFLAHMLNGIRIASKPYKEVDVSVRHAWMLKHPGTYFWFTQVLTGSFIALFGFWHFWVQHSGEPTTTAAQSALRLSPLVFAGYIIFAAALMFHSFNGVRAVLVKLGIMTDRTKEMILVGLVALFFLVFFVLAVWSMGVFMSQREAVLLESQQPQSSAPLSEEDRETARPVDRESSLAAGSEREEDEEEAEAADDETGEERRDEDRAGDEERERPPRREKPRRNTDDD